MPYDQNLFQNPYLSMQNQMFKSPVNGLVWVEGDEGAYAYPLPPNSVSPPLMYNNEPKFAVKTTDAAGIGSIRRFTFTEETVEKAPAVGGDFVTKGDLESFKRDIMEAINGKSIVPAE